MKKKLYVILIFLLMFSCTKESIVNDAEIIIKSPINNQIVSKYLPVNFSIKNLQSSINEIRLLIDDEIVLIKKDGSFYFNYNIESYEDITIHTMQIQIITKSIINSEKVIFKIDKSKPQIIIKEVNKTNDEKIEISTETINEENIDKKIIYIDGEQYVILDGNEEINIDTSKLSVGEHLIEIVIIDTDGNIIKTTTTTIIIESESNNEKSDDKTTENENVETEEIKENEPNSKPEIIYPKNLSGIYATSLKITTKNALGYILQISKNKYFDTIYKEYKITNTNLNLSEINTTNIYYLRIKKDNEFFSNKMIGFIKRNTITINKIEYYMGDPDEVNYAETPYHKVILDKYHISVHEVTRKEFYIFMQITSYTPFYRNRKKLDNDDIMPIANVNWYDVKAFCKWLGVRLPTEAEWEYAAKTSKNYKYSWGNENTKISNVLDSVFSNIPNSLGLYNMSGNVWEWCEDWYDPSYYRYSVVNDPKGPKSGSSKVIRGGSYKDSLKYLTTTIRGAINPYSALTNVGFRIVTDNE